MKKSELSVERGIEIQTEQLALWAKVLKPECFERLQTWAVSTNENAETGFQIVRGSSLDMFVFNDLMRENNLMLRTQERKKKS
ncbi:MAG: hypothetical protein HC836_34610 [Richelia sp. RM2_1_2]|nr:hypothetical protein [Richelia sp. RM2_1_2]